MDEQNKTWVFDYRRTGLVAAGSYLLIAFMPVTMDYVDKSRPDLFRFFFLGLFLLFAICILIKAFGERIILEGGDLIRTSWFGAFTTRIPLSALGPESLKTLDLISKTTFRLSANGKTIRFSSGLSDIGRLLEEIVKAAYVVTPPSKTVPDVNPAVGTYRFNKSSLVTAGFMCIAGLIFFVYGFEGFRQGMKDHFNEVFCFFTGAVVLAFGFRMLRQARFQIVVSPDGIESIDWTGRVKLRVTQEDIIPGTMSWSWDRGGATYRIETTKGPLTWDGQMKDSVRLSRFLREVAQQPYLPIPTIALPSYPGAWPAVRENAVKATKA